VHDFVTLSDLGIASEFWRVISALNLAEWCIAGIILPIENPKGLHENAFTWLKMRLRWWTEFLRIGYLDGWYRNLTAIQEIASGAA
jgi:hypothetical protein